MRRSRLRCGAVLAAFADISICQLLLVAGVALFASMIGGVAGYGTGALMPLVLVPMLGPEPVIPIIALAGTAHQHRPGVRVPALRRAGGASGSCWPARSRRASSPPTATRCSPAGRVQLVIGAMLMLTVPLRYAHAKARDRARRPRAGAGRGRLWRGRRRHGRRRRDPAVGADGGRAAGRRRDRDRRGDLDRDRRVAALGVRHRRRDRPADHRVRAADRAAWRFPARSWRKRLRRRGCRSTCTPRSSTRWCCSAARDGVSAR